MSAEDLKGRPSFAEGHCKRVGITVEQMAKYHDVTRRTVNHWKKSNGEWFDKKLAEAAVALRNGNRRRRTT